MKAKEEKFLYQSTKVIIEDSLPSTLEEECHFDLDSQQPLAIESTKSVYHENRFTKWIEYDSTHGLIHEYQHYFNHGGDSLNPVSWRCLDQVSAYYAARIFELEQQNKRLSSEIMFAKRNYR